MLSSQYKRQYKLCAQLNALLFYVFNASEQEVIIVTGKISIAIEPIALPWSLTSIDT